MGFRMSTNQAMMGIPAYTRHKPSGQARVRLNGVDFYLGPWNTAQSRANYDRVINEWLARGRRVPHPDEGRGELLTKELISGYQQFAVGSMPAVEVEKIRAALTPVRKLYGETPAAEFGPVAFQAVRRTLIEAGLCISTIRDRMGIIKRVVTWGVANEMLPGDALHRLQAVPKLKAGRDGVKASKKVKPASEEHIRAILPHLQPTVRAMVELQALTGMRPGEVWWLTTGQIDRTGNPWIYRPVQHKNAARGKHRDIPIGPKAQEVLQPWLKAEPDAILFSPREASQRFHEVCMKPHRTARQRAKKRKRAPQRVPGVTYNKNSYRQAIQRGCLRAGVPIFQPNQIRQALGRRTGQESAGETRPVVRGEAVVGLGGGQLQGRRSARLAPPDSTRS
jgi:integrase